MIKKTLKAENIEKYEIVEIPDVYDDETWTKSILEKVNFDTVFTRNSWTRRCFDNFKIPVKEHPKFGNISASKIRKMILEGKEWKKFVPKEVQKIIEEIDVKKRLMLGINSSFH